MSDANINEWMAFYGDKFFRACAGFSKEVGFMYLLAIWHYRSHNKCRGLLNQDELLRNICQCDKADWQAVRPLIFDNEFYFVKEKGLWHQKEARRLFIIAQEIAQKNHEKGIKGAAVRWRKKHNEIND